MKSLKQYLLESVRTYHYKIKIVGDCSDKHLDMLRINLQKFSPVKISEPKRTPIQAQPWDFPKFSNEPVTIIDCEFNYPATEPMIKQLWRLCNQDENRLRLVDELGSEIEDRQEARIHDAQDFEAEAKNASEAYGDSYLSWLKDQRKSTELAQEFSAPKTALHDPFKIDRPETLGPISGKNRRQ